MPRAAGEQRRVAVKRHRHVVSIAHGVAVMVPDVLSSSHVSVGDGLDLHHTLCFDIAVFVADITGLCALM